MTEETAMIDIDDDSTLSISEILGGTPPLDLHHMRIILNVLSRWSESFGDDALLRVIVDRLPGQLPHMNAPFAPLLKRTADWISQQANPDDTYLKNFTPYSKFLSREDIHELVINPIVEATPGLSGDIVISDTCTTLSGLLDLTRAETLVLQSAFSMKSVAYPYESIYPRITGMYTKREHQYADMLGLTVETAKAAITGFLTKSGFIINSEYPEGFYELSPVFAQAFSESDIMPGDIEGLLFPNSLTTDLTTGDYPHIEADIGRTEKIINSALENGIDGTNIMLWGPAGTGKTELAIALARNNGWEIKSIGDIGESNTDEKSRADRLANLKIAIKLFAHDGKTVLLFDEIEDLFKTDNNATFSKAFINRIIDTTPVPIIWTTNALALLGAPVLRRMTYNIHCTVPDKTARRGMWEKYATEYGVPLDRQTKLMLDNFDIPPALIHNSMRVTGAALAGSQSNQKDIREIVQSMDRLINFGEKRRFAAVEKDDPLYDVSCVNTEHDLTTFTERLKHAKSHAFSLCLYGPPGTGKSKYGRYLAAQMDKTVLFKRASDLVSKWVGETEANIAEAFEEAKTEKQVLIIDEGDSFLRSRESASQSWEISQVNEILSQMEEHPEPFIITTNLMDHLDGAALRRFAFKMKFDYMTPTMAAKLFRGYYGVEAPARIANQHLLTPGDIACVAKQVSILGVTDAETIYTMIEAEVSLKPDFRKSIGF